MNFTSKEDMSVKFVTVAAADSFLRQPDDVYQSGKLSSGTNAAKLYPAASTVKAC